MKASICLVATSAVLAMAAGPLNKRLVVHTKVETEIVYVTVTAGAEPSTSSSSSISTSTTPPPPPPPPTTTPVAKPAPTPAPEPVYTPPAPAPAPVQTVVQVVQEPAPVAVAAVPEVQAQQSQNQAQQQQSTTTQTSDDLPGTVLYHHNIHRENNSAPALEWGSAYASYAAETAKKCKFEHDMVPGGGNYGQNIAMWASSSAAESKGAKKAIADAISNMWYNGEISLYADSNYGQENPDFSNFEQYGHYTQVVWVGTKQVGCDAHFCPPGTMFPNMGAWFSVCNYFPAGNMGGKYGVNVLRPQGHQTISSD